MSKYVIPGLNSADKYFLYHEHFLSKESGKRMRCPSLDHTYTAPMMVQAESAFVFTIRVSHNFS